LKKGRQKKIEPNSKPKKTKSTCKGKTHSEFSESDLPIDIDEDELYDDDILYDGDDFTDRDACLI
jgi:hypothetical protein